MYLVKDLRAQNMAHFFFLVHPELDHYPFQLKKENFFKNSFCTALSF
jgi:hypothetical protein